MEKSSPKKYRQGLPTIGWISLLLLLSWLVLPLIPLGIWSVSRSWYFPDILPAEFSLHAWKYVFSPSSEILAASWRTAAIAIGVTLISVLIGVPAGRALGLYQFRGKPIVELLILAPTIVPGIAVILGIHVVFLKLGLANNIAGVIIVHLIPSLPYMILVMASVFSNHNPEAEAQARTLGATAPKVFWYVTLPSILPGLLIGSFFVFLVSWSQYILTLVIGGGRVVTLPLLLFNFATSGRNDISGAIGILYILPGVFLILIGSRYITGKNNSLGTPGQI